MPSHTSCTDKAGLTSPSCQSVVAQHPGGLSFLTLCAWCGLAAGLLEVAKIVLRKRFFDWNHFYWMSRHFIWLVPITNPVILLVGGGATSLMIRTRAGRPPWVATRLLGTLSLLPLIWAGFPRIHVLAGLIMAAGGTMRLVPILDRHAPIFRRCARLSFPVLVAAVPILAISLWAGDMLKEWHEASHALPPRGSPNVLLIVLDTVAADHLDLYGYGRPTSPTLDQLATRGLRFDGVRATSSWTLPSHASIFTGRWPHELFAGWLTPFDHTDPTLAEYLCSRGYATAGLTATYSYCASDSGLGRVFQQLS